VVATEYEESTIGAATIQTPNSVGAGVGETVGSNNSARTNKQCSRRATAGTAWNSNELVINATAESQPRRNTPESNFSHIFNDFPVEDRRSDGRATEAKGLQDPLWLLAELAEQGWDLHGRKRPRHPATLASTNLPIEDAPLLKSWTPHALQKVMKEQIGYYEHGLLGSKCDVAPQLDPILRGLVTEEKANQLCEV
jgi:hypothetical protein